MFRPSLIVISALQIKPGVQAIRLLPAEGAAKGMQANHILSNGQGGAGIDWSQGRQTVDGDLLLWMPFWIALAKKIESSIW